MDSWEEAYDRLRTALDDHEKGDRLGPDWLAEDVNTLLMRVDLLSEENARLTAAVQRTKE